MRSSADAGRRMRRARRRAHSAAGLGRAEAAWATSSRRSTPSGGPTGAPPRRWPGAAGQPSATRGGSRPTTPITRSPSSSWWTRTLSPSRSRPSRSASSQVEDRPRTSPAGGSGKWAPGQLALVVGGRLCGEGSSETTRVKPCTRSQMISSWRRTRRWLGAKPPGRSLTASWSWITQVKLRGGMPAAHFPSCRVRRRPAPVATVAVARPGGPHQDGGLHGRRRRRGTRTMRTPCGHGPHGASASEAGQAVRRRAGGRRRPRPRRPGTPCDWCRPAPGPIARPPTSSRQVAQERQVVGDRLAEADPGVDPDLAHPGRAAARAARSTQEAVHLGHHVVVAGVVCIVGRRPLHVHGDPAGTPRSAATGHSEAETSLTRVAPAATAARPPPACTVSTETRTWRRQGLDHRDHPAQLLGLGHRARPRAAGLPAHVDHVGPLGRPWPGPGRRPARRSR